MVTDRLDTAAERDNIRNCYEFRDRQAACDSAFQYLDEIDRLRAENQRLERLIVRDADGQAVTQGRFNAANASVVRLYEANEKLRDELADEATRCRDLWDEAETVLRQLDELASQWGDEAVFRRCRDRLRSAVEAAQ